MKIVFVVNDFYPSSSATSNIILNLAEYLLTAGFKVEVICLKSNFDINDFEIYKGIKVNRITDYTYMFKKSAYNSLKRTKLNSFIKLKHFLFFSAFKISGKIQLRITKDEILKSRVRLYKNRIKKHINQKSIVVSINADFSSALAISALKKESIFKYILYQVDPYSSNYTFNPKNFKNRLVNELRIYEAADIIFMPSSIYEENDILKEHRFKVKTIEFPKIKKLAIKKCSDDIELDKNYTNIVYTGLLYSDIRRPDYFLKLLSRIKNEKIRVYFIGSTIPSDSKRFIEGLNQKLFFTDTLSQQAVTNAMLNADYLLNIGNTIINTLPSKIFEYISTGRPIINFYKTKQCPTLPYLTKYPNCINIYEDETLLDANAKMVSDFLLGKINELPYSFIRNNYFECTLEYVGDKFKSEINTLLNLESIENTNEGVKK